MDRHFLVTGTSYGLGRSIADNLLSRGDQVVSLSRSAPPNHPRETWIQVAQEDTESIAAAMAGLARSPNTKLFDGIVFNAAISDKSVDQWTTFEIERHFRVNALGPVAIWNELTSRNLLAKQCNVVIVGSFLQNGNLRQPAYAMSKAALWAWMRSYTMAQPVDSGISMNMIWPGRVDTPGNPKRNLPPDDANLFYDSERVVDYFTKFLDQLPMGPRGTVLDLGRS